VLDFKEKADKVKTMAKERIVLQLQLREHIDYALGKRMLSNLERKPVNQGTAFDIRFVPDEHLFRIKPLHDEAAHWVCVDQSCARTWVEMAP
jgi:hypothetical protein